MQANKGIVFVIDDSISIRRSLERLIKSVGLTVQSYASADEFLKSGRPKTESCIVLDVRMPGLTGFELQEALAASDIRIPIIFLTGHANVPMSVKAMKAGAIDFIEKPFNDSVLLEAIHKALETDRLERIKENESNSIKEKLDSLTPREYEVLTHVIQGKLNKQIAYDLGIVEKTIKVHRAQVMRKLQVDSLAARVKLAEKVGIGKD